MSTLEDKLEESVQSVSNRARCFLYRHLTYKDGSRQYTIVREDSSGPVIIQTTTRFDGIKHLWRRVYFEGKDILFEAVFDGENHEAYFAVQKSEATHKKKRVSRKLAAGVKKGP